jgi:hypothetical protein
VDAITRARIAGQGGLVTRAQALAAGLTERAIEWRLAKGRWARVHPGVYLTTPGRNDWEMRALAALLHAGPGSALFGRSSGHVWGLCPEQETIEVVLPAARRVRPADGVAIRRSRHVPERVHPTEWPHRVRAEHTVFDMSQGATFDRAVSLVARAIGLGIASAASLRTALDHRRGQTHAGPLREALAEVAVGTESPAELRYVRDVECAHGLPSGTRQAPFGTARPGQERPAGGRRFPVAGDSRRDDRLVLARGTPVAGVGWRDIEYEGGDLVVEVDGRLGHEGWRARQREGRRDRKAAVAGRLTIRCYWPDLVPSACELAADVAAILTQRGWTGRPRPCGKDCPVGRGGGGLEEPAGRHTA